MKKLLLALLAVTPLLAVASQTHVLHFKSAWHFPNSRNPIYLIKVADRCIDFVEPGDGSIDPSLDIHVGDKNDFASCSNRAKWQEWSINARSADGKSSELGKIEFIHWWHSGYLKWMSSIGTSWVDKTIHVTARCREDDSSTFVDCLNKYDSGSGYLPMEATVAEIRFSNY